MKAKLELFLNWGITFPEQLIPKEKKLRPVKYLSAHNLELRILKAFPPPLQQKFTHPGKPIANEKREEKIIQDMQIPADSVTAAVREYEETNAEKQKPSKLTKKSDIKL